MEAIDLKNNLIEIIKSTNNKILLEELYQFLSLNNKTIPPYVLNDEQNEAINVAREQVKKGEYISNDRANKDINEWLKK